MTVYAVCGLSVKRQVDKRAMFLTTLLLILIVKPTWCVYRVCGYTRIAHRVAGYQARVEMFVHTRSAPTWITQASPAYDLLRNALGTFYSPNNPDREKKVAYIYPLWKKRSTTLTGFWSVVETSSHNCSYILDGRYCQKVDWCPQKWQTHPSFARQLYDSNTSLISTSILRRCFYYGPKTGQGLAKSGQGG
jgi:hypothetical protein